MDIAKLLFNFVLLLILQLWNCNGIGSKLRTLKLLLCAYYFYFHPEWESGDTVHAISCKYWVMCLLWVSWWFLEGCITCREQGQGQTAISVGLLSLSGGWPHEQYSKLNTLRSRLLFSRLSIISGLEGVPLASGPMLPFWAFLNTNLYDLK